MKLRLDREESMTAIHRREMFGVMLRGAVAAAV